MEEEQLKIVMEMSSGKQRNGDNLIRVDFGQASNESLGGGGGHSYIMGDIDVRQGLSNPYPLQTKISAKFWTLRRQMAENFRKYILPNARK